MHDYTLGPIETARERAISERDQLRAERDAFEAFVERVLDMDPPASTVAVRSGVRVWTGNAASSDTARLRTAYRETVMAVDHYDGTYGESLRENADAELGADAATLLCNRGSVRGERSVIATAAREAIHNRESVLDHVRAEIESLDSAFATLSDVVAGIDTRRHDRSSPDGVGELLEACESVVERRQETINANSLSPTVDGHDLCQYLYADAANDWIYPVLSVAATIRADLAAVDDREDAGSAPSVTPASDGGS